MKLTRIHPYLVIEKMKVFADQFSPYNLWQRHDILETNPNPGPFTQGPFDRREAEIRRVGARLKERLR